MNVTGCLRLCSPLSAGLLLVTWTACVAPRETQAQEPACFAVELTPLWIAGDLDLDTPGASRPFAGGGNADFELCSQSGGFGSGLDSYRFLAQAGDGDVTLLAVVDSIGSGSAGLLARQDEREAASSHVGIIVAAQAGGGAELRSAVRLVPGEAASEGGTTPVPVALPLLLKIERRGTMLTTYYDSGVGFVEHLSVDTTGSDLEGHRLEYCLAQSSNDISNPTTARFLRASLASDEEEKPGVDCYPSDILVPFEGNVELTLRGSGLDGVRSVILAGIEAPIVAQSPGILTVRVPPRSSLNGSTPVSGDIVLASDHHGVVLPASVVVAGRKYIRGDANSDELLDISDGIYILQFLFLGGSPLECPESGDVNDDDAGDLSDAVFLFQYLFLGASRIPEPFPDPGVDPDAADICGFPPEPVWEGLLDDDGSPIAPDHTLREGDVIVLGLSRSEVAIEATEVLFADTRAEVLEGSTVDRLRLRIGRVPTSGRKCPLVFEKSRVEAELLPELAADIPYANLRGRALDVDPDDELPESCPTFAASTGFDLVATSRPLREDKGIFLEIERSRWSSSSTHQVELRIFPPLLSGGSRGPRLLRFDYLDPPPVAFRGEPDGEEDFARWLSGLARRIRIELAGGDPRAAGADDDCDDGGDCDDVSAEADPEGGGIAIGPCGGTATHVSPFPNGPGPDPGPPGPGTKLQAPKVPKWGGTLIVPPSPCQFVDSGETSQRLTAWCRLAQVTEERMDTGLPQWEYFAPVSAMFNPAGLNKTKQPPERPLAEKRILFNMPAFIHFRFGVHYNLPCVPTQNFLGCGNGNSHWMLSFPKDAFVVKTFWRSASYLPESADVDDYYSYMPPGELREYLVGMHLSSKDSPGSVSGVGSWLWATFFVPPPPGDTLDKGGRPLSDRFHNACVAGHRNDMPLDIEGVWRNFVLCVDGEGPSDRRCGNPWGPKDECLGTSCNGCHTTLGRAEYPVAIGGERFHQFQWMSSLRPSPSAQTECYDLLKPLIDEGKPTPYSQFATPECE